MAIFHLLRLPVELRLQILDHLDIVELLTCRSLCKIMMDLIDSSTVLKYNVLLSQAGYVDCGGNYTSSERLVLLQDHIDRWQALDWTEHKIRLRSSHLYEFFSGIYCTASSDSMICVELPSRITGRQMRSWKHTGFGFELVDFTFDPVQDLLVLLEPAPDWSGLPVVHFKTLSTNSQHRRAALSRVTCRKPCFPGTTVMRIYGKYVGIMYSPSPQRHGRSRTYLQFIDWTNGNVHPAATFMDGPRSWCFVTPDSVLVPKRDASLTSTFGLALCKIDPSSADGLGWIAFLALPSRKAFDRNRAPISIFSDPASLDSTGNSENRPFSIDDKRIIKIEWLTTDPLTDVVERFDIHVMASSIAKYLAPASKPPAPVLPLTGHESTVHFETRSRVQWDEWGTQQSRVAWKTSGENEFACSTYGTRSVSLTNSQTVAVRTFAPGLAQWARKDTRNSSDFFVPRSAVTNINLGTAGDVLAVTSCLPYSFTRRSLEKRHEGIFPNGIMVDDERIVLVEKFDPSGDETLIIYCM